MRGKDGRLLRIYAAVPGEKPTARGNAFLDDYAFVLHGLLTLHDATNDKKWLDEAKAIADTMIKWHGDEAKAGFFFTAHDHEKLFARAKDSYDGAQPSGNGIAARSLLRLWRKTNDLKYRDLCFRSVKSYAGVLRMSPGAVPVIARTLDELLDVAEKDPTAIAPKDAGTPAVAPKNPREAADVVSAKLETGKVVDGKQSFTVTLTVAEPWHVYASPVGNETLKASETTVEVFVGGKKVEAKIAFPKGKAAKDKSAGEYQIYEGTAKITGSVPRGKDGELEVRVKLMACKDGLCLLPSTIKLK
jgi:hypothetical protein